ncbi:hypothetical protein KGQ20_04210 [Catenulispora sp. NF23]|uniref:Uncharacterized protein n=1 Tax=Catenulispora pinistramenti TaxID=2705254 RepID=A0ABS5KKB6_9ACTN|nr:hypothetical protein [Catenulispora pinistramenti]MBS2531968.1 hypothetical protein [Catenulispora pinistramenti]MBS2546236.1 hypothetical protein [Catenulispora pinistramenti]
MPSTGGNSASTARSFWIYFWIYTGLILGALASVSANIAYTYIPPHIQPAWWPRSRLWDPAAYIPPPGDVAVAVFCPVSIFILTEVITRPRWREGKLSFAVRAVSAVMVGLPVAVASYLHLCSLLEYYSTIPFIAYTLPLTVDGLMLACTAALQLTGHEPQQARTDGDAAVDVPPSIEALVPRPRLPLDDTIPTPHGAPSSLGGRWPTVPTLVSVPELADADEPPPVVSPTAHAGGSTKPVGQRYQPAAPPVDAESDSYPPANNPGVSEVGHSPLETPPVALVAVGPEVPIPPVSLVGLPVGVSLLPLELLAPPPPTRGQEPEPPEGTEPTRGTEPSPFEPTGDRVPESGEGVAVRPVPFGRLGASDLADAEIIKLATADSPYDKVTATGLRKDFGVGPGRGARIRDAIARRRLAARLAAGLREQIERLRTTDTPESAQASEPTEQQPTSPDSGDMEASIKPSSELSRPGA